MLSRYLIWTEFLAIIVLGLLLGSCGGDNRNPPVVVGLSGNETYLPEQLPIQSLTAGWLDELPVDRLQPWEMPSNDRGTSAINEDSDFTPGVERFSEYGEVTDRGEASHVESGSAGSGAASYALYRIDMHGTQPGAISADVNCEQRSDGSPSEYWLGLARYDRGTWEWYGPYRDSHVRLSLGAKAVAGGNYLSALGNLFINVAASNGSVFDIVGLGVNGLESPDSEPPPTPAMPLITPVAGGLLLEWLPVLAGDLAGYQIYYRTDWFLDKQATGIKRVDYLEGGTRHLLGGLTLETFVRISAVDITGNESTFSDLASAVPLPGEPPALSLSVSAPNSRLNELVTLSADGAETYDWDLDGDGSYDITGDATGAAEVNTGHTGIIRPAVRASIGDGSSLALGAVSLIVSGNARPVASGFADPSYGLAPLTVSFTGTGEDMDGEIVLYSWDFNGDGIYDWSDPASASPPDEVFSAPYLHNAKFRVDDDLGAYDVDTVPVQVVANLPPLAQLQVNNSAGDVPFTAEFDASASVDLDGSIVSYEWDWEGDDIYDENTGSTAISSHYYDEPFNYIAHVRVTDDQGAIDIAFTQITARGAVVRTADGTVGAGFQTSIAVIDGRPAIAYRDNLLDELKFVRAGDEYGLSWDSPVTVDSDGDTGQHNSLRVVDGRPAISYYVGDPEYDLRYVRANNADGSSWGPPTTPDGSGDVGLYSSLAVVNGYPAISYYDGSANTLKYVQASDAAGVGWNSPEVVDSDGNTGWFTSLAIVDANPAISYYVADPDYDLRFVRAEDADGASWGTPVTVDSVGDVGLHTSLAIVHGRPAISYQDGTDLVLKYVRATDAAGETWHPPLVVDSSYKSGGFSSLAVIRGWPAIGYYDDNFRKPRYVRATDQTGSFWSTPQTADQFLLGGAWTSMAEVNGYAGLSFSDPGHGILKYALIIE